MEEIANALSQGVDLISPLKQHQASPFISSALKEQLRMARAELVEDMEKYSGVLGCYMILNRQGVIQYLNLQGLDILDAELLQQYGWNLGYFFPDSDRSHFHEFVSRVFINGNQEHCEVRLQTSEDKKLWVRLEAKASYDGESCHVVLFDITESKREEAYLAASEMKYRALFANMNTAFSYHKVIRGNQGNVFEPILMEANDAYGMMLGMPVREIIGKNSCEINAAGYAPSLDWEQLCNDVVIQRQPACFDYYDKTLKRWLSVIAYSPAPEHMALVYVDITKTKVAEQMVSESEQRYRNLIQGTDVVIMILNGRAEITFINEFGLSFFGFSEQELISKSIFKTIAPVYDTVGPNFQEVFEKFKGKAGQQRRKILENLTRSGRRVWMDWTNHELMDPKTGETMLICVGVDVTDSKRSEQEALRKHKQQRQKELLNAAIHKGFSMPEWVSAAQQLGIDLHSPFFLSLLEIPANYLSPGVSEQDRIERQYAIDNMIETLQYVGAGVTWQAPDGIAILRAVPEKGIVSSSKQARTIATDIVDILSRYWKGMNMKLGVSRFSNQTQNIGEMYAQAHAAITFGPILHPECSVHYWHDLGFYQFILQDLGSEQAQRFVRDSLGPLLSDHTEEDPGELLLTLKELLSGESAQVIAKKLQIHPQTVAFRKKKIEKSLGADLDSMEVRLRLTIATRMLSFFEKKVRMVHLVV